MDVASDTTVHSVDQFHMCTMQHPYYHNFKARKTRWIAQLSAAASLAFGCCCRQKRVEQLSYKHEIYLSCEAQRGPGYGDRHFV